MRNEPEPLSSKQERALELALQGLSDLEIARSIKVSRQTIYNWRYHHDGFGEASENQRKALSSMHMDSLNTLVEEAVGVVRGALHSQNEMTRLKAATLVLRVAGLQEQMRAKQKEENPWQKFMNELSLAIDQVRKELGFQEPTQTPAPRQMEEGRE